MNLLSSIGNASWARGFKPVKCGNRSCSRWLTHAKLAAQPVGVTMSDIWYCGYRCFAGAAEAQLARLLTSQRTSTDQTVAASLGLTLLRLGLLTDAQYRHLTTRERSTGEDLGNMASAMGLLTDQQVTFARAAQWNCPVFPVRPGMGRDTIRIPHTLTQRYGMLPLYHVAAGNRVFIGFRQRVDYAALFAVEQVTGLTTHPCFLSPADFRALSLELQEGELTQGQHVERQSDIRAMTRSLCAMGASVDADHVIIVRCGDLIWARLRTGARPTDLFFEANGAMSATLNVH